MRTIETDQTANAQACLGTHQKVGFLILLLIYILNIGQVMPEQTVDPDQGIRITLTLQLQTTLFKLTLDTATKFVIMTI